MTDDKEKAFEKAFDRQSATYGADWDIGARWAREYTQNEMAEGYCTSERARFYQKQIDDMKEALKDIMIAAQGGDETTTERHCYHLAEEAFTQIERRLRGEGGGA